MTRVIESKYVGSVIDSYWEVTYAYRGEDDYHAVFHLKNNQNGFEVDITDQQYRQVVRGQNSVSRIISRRIRKKKFHKPSKRDLPKIGGKDYEAKNEIHW